MLQYMYFSTYLSSLVMHHIHLYNNELSSTKIHILQHSCQIHECTVKPLSTTTTNTKKTITYKRIPLTSNKYKEHNFPVQLYLETPYLPPSPSYFKVSLHNKIIIDQCEQSWLCNRCL